MPSHPDDDAPLRDRVQAGDHHALGELFGRHRERLDPEDVLQEAFLDAARRLAEYSADPRMPPFLWLRFLTIQRLQTLHRLHLGAQGRDVSREVAIVNGSLPA